MYTDSGYTTKSQNYGDKYDTYLVAERYIPQVSGAYVGVDYKKIKEMVSTPMASQVNLQPILTELKAISRPLSEIPKLIKQLTGIENSLALGFSTIGQLDSKNDVQIKSLQTMLGKLATALGKVVDINGVNTSEISTIVGMVTSINHTLNSLDTALEMVRNEVSRVHISVPPEMAGEPDNTPFYRKKTIPFYRQL